MNPFNDLVAMDPRITLKGLFDSDAEILCTRERGVETRRVNHSSRNEHFPQAIRFALKQRGMNQTRPKHNPSTALVARQCKHPRLLRQTYDLQDVSEAQILEIADQAH